MDFQRSLLALGLILVAAFWIGHERGPHVADYGVFHVVQPWVRHLTGAKSRLVISSFALQVWGLLLIVSSVLALAGAVPTATAHLIGQMLLYAGGIAIGLLILWIQVVGSLRHGKHRAPK